MNLGFIGTGGMGSVLVAAFIRSGAVRPQQIAVSNRTKSKAENLACQFPGIRVLSTNQEVAKKSDVIFVCVKPMEYRAVLRDIRRIVLPGQTVVSITSPVLLEQLENALDCKIVKMIPSVTHAECGGAALCIYGERMTAADIARFESLVSHIGKPLAIDEKHTRIASDISSIGPAFLAFFVGKLVDAAVEKTGVDRNRALELAAEMTLGTGKLLAGGRFTPETLQQKVAVPGGITAEALSLLEKEAGHVFRQVVAVTHRKYEEDLRKVAESLQQAWPD